MVEARDGYCEKCAKFSHCNNNDLVCIAKFNKLKNKLERIKNIIVTPDRTYGQYRTTIKQVIESE